jgi:CHAT domain-containing protein
VLLLEPDGVPGAIPFEALVRPHGKWLGEEFTIIQSPGLWAELALRPLQRPVSTDTHAVIVGNPLHLSDEVLPPLGEAEREAQHVATLLPSNRSFLGVDATPTAVRAALLNADVFHFAGHARFDGESARLLLSGQRAVMDAEAIETASRRCKLAVLSACSTAASEIQGPWNVDSLVQAFWRAGAPHVVASRWDVDSSATAQLFREFYLRLLRGETVAGALALANSALRLQSETAHPYFWSAFGLFGCAPDGGSGRPKSRL